MRKIEKTPYYSKKLGELPKGCQMCVRGEKLVLYITGICPRNCWYCPLSENRKNKDRIYVNEWKTNSKKDMETEIRLGQAKGAGITGGDPLAKIDRTVDYIKFLKKKHGKDFHIHLYTSLVLVNEENMKKLYEAGLDEIRFHPDFKKKEDYKNFKYIKEYDWDIGIEIPVIPNEKENIIELINIFKEDINFLNLNELEISELNSNEMYKRGFKEKSDISYAIKGSSKLANEILEYCKPFKFNVHFCTSKLKDRVQMQNRFKLRAESIKTKYDIITDEGLLLRGIIYIKTNPKMTKNEIITELKNTYNFLSKEGLELHLDRKKLRLITYPEHVEQFKGKLKELGLVPAIIEEDPTIEAFEVNKEFL